MMIKIIINHYHLGLILVKIQRERERESVTIEIGKKIRLKMERRFEIEDRNEKNSIVSRNTIREKNNFRFSIWGGKKNWIFLLKSPISPFSGPVSRWERKICRWTISFYSLKTVRCLSNQTLRFKNLLDSHSPLNSQKVYIFCSESKIQKSILSFDQSIRCLLDSLI